MENKGLGFFRTVFYLPNLITLASVTILFRVLLDWQRGPFNQVLLSLSLIDKPIDYLNLPSKAQAAVSLIQAWMWFGNSFLFLMAGVTGISKDYFEAAKVDGANRMQMFTKITLPLLKPIMLYVAITSLIGGMQIFELPLLLTGGLGAPKGALITMVLMLYNQAFRFKNFGYAATIAYGIFFITILFSIISYRVMYANKNKGGVN
jgi:ABC-type sugar transport system permease subunit